MYDHTLAIVIYFLILGTLRSMLLSFQYPKFKKNDLLLFLVFSNFKYISHIINNSLQNLFLFYPSQFLSGSSLIKSSTRDPGRGTSCLLLSTLIEHFSPWVYSVCLHSQLHSCRWMPNSLSRSISQEVLSHIRSQVLLP